MNVKKTLAGACLLAGALALASPTAALADGITADPPALQAVGSDTTQNVVGALATSINAAAGSTVLSSWDAVPVGTNVTTRTAAFPNCVFARPNGSGAGRDALAASLNGVAYPAAPPAPPQVQSPDMTGCVNVARMSSLSNPSGTFAVAAGALTAFPMAVDGLSYAFKLNSGTERRLNYNTIKAIYSANGTPGASSCGGYTPLLPQAGSGTRSFWLSFLGLTELTGATPFGTCVWNGAVPAGQTGAGTVIEEHDGRTLPNSVINAAGNTVTTKAIAPFSIAQWISQSTGNQGDLRGQAVLGGIDFGASGTANSVPPIVLNTGFSGTGHNANRTVYNVVRTDELASNPAVASTFQGAGSGVCSRTTIIQRFGFAAAANCGVGQLNPF